MENIDIASTVELLLGIAILYFIAKSLIKIRSEKNVIVHIETPAPYKVETPAPVVETVPIEGAGIVDIPAPKTRARKDASKTTAKPVAKRAPAKKTAKKKPAAQ